MKHLHPHWHSIFTVPMNKQLTIFDSIRNYYHINASSFTRAIILYDI